MSTSTENDDLSLEDVNCPICLETMILPITMPCKHSLCKGCFEQAFEQADKQQCSLCKERYGSWYRKKGNIENCINQILWAKIQRKFPDIVEATFTGVIAEDEAIITNFSPNISETGQMGQEWAKEVEKLKKEEDMEREKELRRGNRETEVLLKKIQREELGNGEDIVEHNVSEEIFGELQKDREEKLSQSKADEDMAKQIEMQWRQSELSPEEIRLKEKEKEDEEYAKKLQAQLLEMPEVSNSFAESRKDLKDAIADRQKEHADILKRAQKEFEESAKLARKLEREEQEMEQYYGTTRKPLKFKRKPSKEKGVKFIGHQI